MPGILYIVATPIGNLGDITVRALDVFKSVDFILCEDTRVTQKLLAHYGIKRPVVRYNEHQDNARQFVDMLLAGKNLALVSDAGTPGISDPGNRLVRELGGASDTPPKIVPIPGPSALTAAASVAGFSMDKFVFAGFPPVKNKRKKFFAEVASAKYPVVLYESPHRILKTLGDLSGVIPQRAVVVCRELTKKFESVYRGKAVEVLQELHKDKIRGEFVIIIDS